MSVKASFSVQAKFQFYKDEESFVVGWRDTARSNVNHKTFLEGILLKSVDSPYPYVDYSVFYGGVKDIQGLTFQHVDNNHVNNVLRVQNHRYSTDIPPSRITEQGCYDEIECILRDNVKQLPRAPVSKDSVYFLSAFYSPEQTSSLEKLWKIWSGANFILWKCPSELNLRRITFLKTTTNTDVFTYLILCECEEGLNVINYANEVSGPT
ncbi:hypothetical protein KUTeg_007509 [Tegillarca granosa]|uniref:DUF7153 domain-containing protein n=1 Tax=Tegillarca granosa TaxID=220873 RepID=A0ABQ9FDH4_TEGGR|nr:hypothetical protein KUTeg_007509 [Tegillarca granosa]